MVPGFSQGRRGKEGGEEDVLLDFFGMRGVDEKQVAGILKAGEEVLRIVLEPVFMEADQCQGGM